MFFYAIVSYLFFIYLTYNTTLKNIFIKYIDIKIVLRHCVDTKYESFIEYHSVCSSLVKKKRRKTSGLTISVLSKICLSLP